jgi:FAD/FMN-containing dehydrogenase
MLSHLHLESFEVNTVDLVMLVSASWALPSDDATVLAAAQNIVTSINSTAHQLGLGHRYIYQNYASAAQNVFWGYGEENLEKLKAVRKKYDPSGVFEKLQPGYFKL